MACSDLTVPNLLRYAINTICSTFITSITIIFPHNDVLFEKSFLSSNKSHL